MIKILFFGDVVGKIGRRALKKVLPGLKKKYKPDLIIANGENLAHGLGLTKKILLEMIAMGFNFITSGNHIWRKKEIEEIFADPELRRYVIRPANWPQGVSGDGAALLKVGKFSVLVINLMGRVFIDQDLDCPFKKLDQILAEYKGKKINAIIIDFHGEATSEKVALGLYADGRVSAVLGTHTHVGTADAKILPGGTGHLVDVGMVGAKDSVIGMRKDEVLAGFLTQLPQAFEPPESGEAIVNGVYLEIDSKTHRTKKIIRVDLETKV
jgi:2',3'-cyclic-nucleotide 2'-phosphodiesterase